MPTNCLLKTNDVSDTPLLSAVNKVFVFLFCNFLNKIFFSWSAKVVLILFAGIEETLFDRATICAIPIVESGVVGVPATVYSTVVSVLYSIKNLPLYFTSLWSFITTVLDVPVPASKENEFRQYEFSIDNLEEFIGYKIKIVMSGTNEAKSPRFKDLRTIALA